MLGQNWVFTPAAVGSDAHQINDGTSVNGLNFAGTRAGDYDTFSQTFATNVGSTYTYAFTFTALGGESGFMVTANVASAVPEASTWAMMLLGFVGLGFAAYRKTMIGSEAVAIA